MTQMVENTDMQLFAKEIKMFKTVGAFVLLFITVFMLIGITIVYPVDAFSGSGVGTLGDPYVITTPAEWAELESYPSMTPNDKYYILGNDIDFGNSESDSIVISYFFGNLDGQSHSLKNFYNTTAQSVIISSGGGQTDHTLAMISRNGGQGQGVLGAAIIQNIVLQHCVLEVNNGGGLGYVNIPSANDWHANFALFTGEGDAVLKNVYVDQDSWLRINGDINITRSSTRIGVVRSGIMAGSKMMTNVVSRGNLYVKSELRDNRDITGHDGDQVGGLSGMYGCYGVINVISAGTMNYTVDAYAEGYTNTPTPSGNSRTYCSISAPIYYDETTLSGVTPSYESSDVVTANIKLMSSFPNLIFGITGFRISNLTSKFEGYPIPYYFDDSDNVGTPPTPTPTPTGTPIPTVTVTGTPTPSVTTVPTTGTPVPTTVAPQSPTGSVVWMKSNQSTATTSAYLGEPLKIVFDTLNAGQNGNSLTMDYFLLRIYKKDVQMNTFQFSEYLGYYGMPYGASAYLYKPWVNAWSPYNDLRIVGYNDYNYIPGELHYPTNATSLRVELVGLNLTEYYGGGVVHVLSSSTISLTKSPFLVQNFTDWIKSIGGDGLAYVVAMLIIIVLACIPFLIFRRIVMILEIMMIAIGLGLTFMLGLISLWIVFGVGVGLVAIFILTRGNGVQ